MANELTLNAKVAYNDGISEPVDLPVVDLIKSVSTKITHRGQQSVGTSEAALNLGSVATPGYMILVNRDPTNYVDVRSGTGTTKFARLEAGGGFCVLKAGPDVTVPYVIANTAACILDVLICSP